MGFLDHSNANVIVDVVLTDVGRKFLARNDGSFSIVKYAFGDDEVDYGTVTKFGLVVGKEKIEKNTPIFEAQTTAALALKYKCVSLSNSSLTRIPTLSIGETSGAAISSNAVSITLGSSSTNFTAAKVSQSMSDSTTVNAELRDGRYLVRLNSKFLRIRNASPLQTEPNGASVYSLVASPSSDGGNGTFVEFTFDPIMSSSSTDFTTYGNGSSIVTQATVIGVQSGAVVDLTVTINKS